MYHPNQDGEHIQHPRGFLVPLTGPSHPPRPQVTPDLPLSVWVSLHVLELNINGIIQYVFFCLFHLI